LNRCDLKALWKISARLSLHDAYAGIEDPLLAMPLLNKEKIRIFDQAILESRADYDRTRVPDIETMRRVLNDCNDVTVNTPGLARLQEVNGTDRVHLEFQLFLAQMANVQFPPQDPRARERSGRLIAMLEALPRSHADRIPIEQRARVEQLLPEIVQFLGTPISRLARCFFDVLLWQSVIQIRSRQRLEEYLALLPYRTDERERQWLITSALFDLEPSLDPFLEFNDRQISILRQGREAERGPDLAQFCRIFSATVVELRAAMNYQPEYQAGHVSSRLSPLERFPLVRIEAAGNEPSYIVPNVPHLTKSFSPVLDHYIGAEFGERYNHVRGALLELYVQCLIENQLPDLMLIPETAYGRRGGERRGADLTIIDRRCRRLVLVEVKGKRIGLITRLTMEPEGLRSELDRAYRALRELPRKVEDLYAGRPEYEPYQGDIELTRGSEPLFVVVVSEGVYSMGELVRVLATQPNDPLYGYPYRYCVFSLDIFEKVVAISKKTERPLVDLLEEHWERSLRQEYNELGADSFGGVVVEEEEIFAGQFAPEVEA
jgi:hypothetical protein